MSTLVLMPAEAVHTVLGLKKTQFYERIKQGLFPPPIITGVRSRVWLAHEVEAVLAAHASGMQSDEIGKLVAALVGVRRGAFDRLAQSATDKQLREILTSASRSLGRRAPKRVIA